MIDWKKKLGSRKFWGLLIALATAVLLLLNVPSGNVEQIVAIIGAFASIAVYILAEAYVDGKSVGILTDDSPIDWKQKLGSRKFWSLVMALATAVLVFFNVPAGTIASITAAIGAFAAIIMYILAEAYVDGQAADFSVLIEDVLHDTKEDSP